MPLRELSGLFQKLLNKRFQQPIIVRIVYDGVSIIFI